MTFRNVHVIVAVVFICLFGIGRGGVWGYVMSPVSLALGGRGGVWGYVMSPVCLALGGGGYGVMSCPQSVWQFALILNR